MSIHIEFLINRINESMDGVYCNCSLIIIIIHIQKAHSLYSMLGTELRILIN